MDGNNLPGETPIAPIAAPAPASPPATPGARVMAAIAGALLLLLLVTRLKVALVGLVGIAVVWGVQRVRRRPYTRAVGWAGAVVGTIVAALISLGVIALMAPPGTIDSIMQKASQDQARRQQQPLPTFLRRMQTNPQAAQAGQAVAQHALQSRGFVTALLGFVALVGSAMAGVLLGSVSWACVTALLYATFGRWTFGPPPA